MTSEEQISYRIRLAEGFLKEAEDDFSGKRWRSCVDNCQLSVENSAKAIIGCFGPIGKGDEPAIMLKQIMEDEKIDKRIKEVIVKGWSSFEGMGFEQHVLSDYGDEENLILPWELFKAEDAAEALRSAKTALDVVGELRKLL